MLTKTRLNELYNNYRKEFAGAEIVLGDGNIENSLMLIGEAPGKDEVREGRPFVGMAGKNLSQFLDVLNLKREDIFITNAIKYRLGKISPKSGRTVNRPATKTDVESNRQYLLKEIDTINPKVVVTLGNVPLRAVTSEKVTSIGGVHGQPSEFLVEGKKRIIFPLYRPASIIYNSSLKDIYMQDLSNLSRFLRDN